MFDTNYDDEILHAACFLHCLAQGNHEYEIESAQEAVDHLHSLGFSSGKTMNVYEAILTHRPKGHPKSIEAKLLHDAVALDYMGATGIASLSGMTLPEWWGKDSLKNVIELWEGFMTNDCYKALYLPKSKKIGRWKKTFVKIAVKQLKAELMLGDVK